MNHSKEIIDCSVQFNQTWQEEISSLKDDEKQFMQKMHDILYAFQKTCDGEDVAASVYEFPLVLGSFKEVIELYQKLFHVVNTTAYWKNEK